MSKLNEKLTKRLLRYLDLLEETTKEKHELLKKLEDQAVLINKQNGLNSKLKYQVNNLLGQVARLQLKEKGE